MDKLGNVSVNKVRKMIYGLSEEEINPSEGYIPAKTGIQSVNFISKRLKTKMQCSFIERPSKNHGSPKYYF